MSYLDEVIGKIKSQYPNLSSEFGIKRIGVFGSVAKKADRDQSDIDLVVEFDRPIGLKFIPNYAVPVFKRHVLVSL